MRRAGAFVAVAGATALLVGALWLPERGGRLTPGSTLATVPASAPIGVPPPRPAANATRVDSPAATEAAPSSRQAPPASEGPTPRPDGWRALLRWQLPEWPVPDHGWRLRGGPVGWIEGEWQNEEYEQSQGDADGIPPEREHIRMLLAGSDRAASWRAVLAYVRQAMIWLNYLEAEVRAAPVRPEDVQVVVALLADSEVDDAAMATGLQVLGWWAASDSHALEEAFANTAIGDVVGRLAPRERLAVLPALGAAARNDAALADALTGWACEGDAQLAYAGLLALRAAGREANVVAVARRGRARHLPGAVVLRALTESAYDAGERRYESVITPGCAAEGLPASLVRGLHERMTLPDADEDADTWESVAWDHAALHCLGAAGDPAAREIVLAIAHAPAWKRRAVGAWEARGMIRDPAIREALARLACAEDEAPTVRGVSAGSLAKARSWSESAAVDLERAAELAGDALDGRLGSALRAAAEAAWPARYTDPELEARVADQRRNLEARDDAQRAAARAAALRR